MPLFRRRRSGSAAPVPELTARRAHPGLLRRERRALLSARDDRLRDLGGIVVEMYRRSAWRADLVQERCAEVVGIDGRLAEIDALLHGNDGASRCTCGATVLRSSHFCPNCGRALDGSPRAAAPEDTMIQPPSAEGD